MDHLEIGCGTVFVVDDDPAVRDAVTSLVESVGLKAGAFASAREFLEALQPGASGCIVLDVRMSPMSGLDLQEELLRRGIMLPVIIVSGHGDIPMAVQALRRGAVDFLEKPFRNQVLLDRINEALRKEAKQRSEQVLVKELQARHGLLTPREQEVLRLVVQGKPYKTIAIDLGLSPRTVEIHLAHIKRKMGAQSISDLMQWYLELSRYTRHPV